jgi:kynurenine 3-monooxygenase
MAPVADDAAEHTVSTKSIAVAGAGLTGALAAIRLARRGHDITIYERRDDPRRAQQHEGRSINLALSTRGIDALERIGLADAVRATGMPMRGRLIHTVDAGLAFQPYSIDPTHQLLSVDRDRLNATLLDAVDSEPGVQLRFGHKLLDFSPTGDVVRFAHHDETISVKHDIVVGADGAFSAVRARMQRLDRFEYEQDYLEHSYKELTIPAASDGSPLLDPNALHIWPRGGHMMIALPNPDGSFTCTLFWPFGGPDGFESIDTEREIEQIFARDFADAAGLVPDLAAQYLHNPTSSLVTIRCAPWHIGGHVVLLGDAAHAVVPFYGQGANAALEDVSILMDSLETHHDQFEPAFAAFFVQRKPDADALAELALDNFVEMRDKVASRRFRAETAFRLTLERRFPRRFVPLYEMVTFSRTPYAAAVARASRQDHRMRQLVAATAVALVAALVLLVVWMISWS